MPCHSACRGPVAGYGGEKHLSHSYSMADSPYRSLENLALGSGAHHTASATIMELTLVQQIHPYYDCSATNSHSITDLLLTANDMMTATGLAVDCNLPGEPLLTVRPEPDLLLLGLNF